MDSTGAGCAAETDTVVGPAAAGAGVDWAASGTTGGGGASSDMACWATFQTSTAVTTSAPPPNSSDRRTSECLRTPTGARSGSTSEGASSLKRATAASGFSPSIWA